MLSIIQFVDCWIWVHQTNMWYVVIIDDDYKYHIL